MGIAYIFSSISFAAAHWMFAEKYYSLSYMLSKQKQPMWVNRVMYTNIVFWSLFTFALFIYSHLHDVESLFFNMFFTVCVIS